MFGQVKLSAVNKTEEGKRKDSLTVPVPGTFKRQALSRHAVKSHDKSFHDVHKKGLQNISEIERINSWVSAVSVSTMPSVETVEVDNRTVAAAAVQPMQQQSPAPASTTSSHSLSELSYDSSMEEFTSRVQEIHEHMPTVTLEEPDKEKKAGPSKVLVAGEAALKATDSSSKIALMQSIMSCDSKGNMLDKISMSPKGRYQSKRSDSNAFRRISLVEAKELHTIAGGSVGTASTTSLSTLRLGKQTKRNSTLVKMIQGRKSRNDSEDRLDKLEVDTPTTMGSEYSAYTQDDDDAESVITGMTPSTMSTSKSPTPKKKGALGMGTIHQLRKWRLQSRDKYGFNNPKTFAKTEMHLTYLKQHGLEVACEVPMPLKVAIYKEILPINQAIAADYAKNLGKSHALSKQAKEVSDEIQEMCYKYKGGQSTGKLNILT